VYALYRELALRKTGRVVNELFTIHDPSTRPGRDPAIDIIKGMACLLMVAAHVHFARAPWLQTATMATVLFFASTGMNLAAITEQRPGRETYLAMNAAFLIFAGFADNYVQGTMRSCDVFQSAGIAVLSMLLLRRMCPRYWGWLFPLPFLVHLANQSCHWKTSDAGVSSFFLAPGLFPLLPWLSFYLLGAHLRLQKQRFALILAGISVVLMGMLRLFAPFHFDKWWMSPDYFLIGCTVTSVAFAARHWLTFNCNKFGEIRKWGANSLVFYILSNFVLRILGIVIQGGLLLFALSLVLSAVLLRPALELQYRASRQRPEMILTAGAAIALGVLVGNSVLWSGSNYPRTIASFGMTLSFCICHPAWKQLIRRESLRNSAREIRQVQGASPSY
jgi:hypothetical protein